MRRADVVVLSALAMEYRATVTALAEADASAEYDGGDRVAVIGRLRVTAMCLAAMGNVGAAAGAQLAIDTWRPQYLILVGIAAGNGNIVARGDIVVADTVVGYEPGKHHKDGLQRRPDVYRPAFSLLTAAKKVTADEWVPAVQSARPHTGTSTADVHFGSVLTGEKVLADGQVFADLRRLWPATVGVEMEGLGIATAAHRSGVGFLVAKGVSDFADETKDDSWQGYAAAAAAHFVVAVLRRWSSTPRDEDVNDFRQPVRAAIQRFALARPEGRPGRIAAVAGSLYRSRGADIWVNSENTDMEMSRTTEFTVSAIIRYWGAVRDASGKVVDDVIASELAHRVSGRLPVAPGTAVVTGSGALADSHGVWYVIHVASVTGEPGSGFRQVRNIASCVTNALVEADRLARAEPSLQTILFPLLGTGMGGGPIETTVATMIDTFVEFLLGHPLTPLAEIRLLGFNAAEWRAVTGSLESDPRLTRLGDQ